LASNSSDQDAEFWQRFVRDQPVNELQAAKEGARQIVTITSALQGLLFAVMPLKDVRVLFANWKGLFVIIPSLFWLCGLIVSIIVLVPHRVSVYHSDDTQEISEKVTKAAATKLKYLRIAQWSLVLGLFALLFLSAVYFLSR
jgi:hypothetical protein